MDQNRSNNDPVNLRTLCANCHALAHCGGSRRESRSAGQQLILAQLQASRARRKAAALEEERRRSEMRREIQALLRAGRKRGLGLDEMYSAAGVRRPSPRASAQRLAPASPLSGSSHDVAFQVELAKCLRALSDSARLSIVEILSRVEEAPVDSFVRALDLSQPTISHHMRILRQAGVVEVASRSGTWTYYRLVPDAIETVASALGRFGTACREDRTA
jgi:ArsR family transcriptional regulator, arsenate/arsenite/antimonite-responsive transcriptional repressor